MRPSMQRTDGPNQGALADALADAAPGQYVALDCTCGTGQLSVLLADRFEHVIAADASAAQVAPARPHARVAYSVAPAERSGQPAARAASCRSRRQPTGSNFRPSTPRCDGSRILALITYWVLHIDDAAIDAVTQRFYGGTLGPYWPPKRRHVEDGYRMLPFPFPAVAMPELAIRLSWGRSELIGYTETWSAVRALETALGRALITAFQDALAAAWGAPTVQRDIRWPLSVRAGRL
ncbi:SAM-dependent methyltransferase [Methylobacterium sp. Leaf89]|uniref:SAM-dependent methyltransferase n=1 Tax=Methylobacterium sp. Leaf89 TaxID=1736245 RepID=UPI000A7B892D|nr:SAM-dependent methyltransferase [Methylobacterium sp. Leaf89]